MANQSDRYVRHRDLDALVDRVVKSLQSKQQTLAGQWAVRTVRVAVGATPVILLGASADVPITWSSPFPGDGYLVDASPIAGLLGNATLAPKAGTQTAAGITITVTAGVLVAVGSQFVVVAIC